MANEPLPSPEVLRQLLSYDPEAGKLFWKERAKSLFPSARTANSWNSRYSGKEALFKVDKGYKRGMIFRRMYLAHRVVFTMHSGVWPVGVVDHVNGDTLDNRICNLREATVAENTRNRKPHSGGTSTFRGVHWHRAASAWVASITTDGVSRHLGIFKTEIEAAFAYDAAAMRAHGSFARVNFTFAERQPNE